MNGDDISGLGPEDFRLVFEAAPMPFLLLAPDSPRFTIRAVNDAYLAATGVARAEILGRGLFEVFPDNPDDAGATGVSDLRTSLDRVLGERRADTMGVQKYDIPARDGSDGFEVKYWSPVNTPILDAAGQVRFLLHRVEDITEFVLARERSRQEQAEQVRRAADRMEAEVLRAGADLKKANRQLKETGRQLAAANLQLTGLDRAKTEFFANVSHEFRTPLTLILGPLDELLAGDRALAEADRRLVRTAHAAGRRLLRLVSTLLDFARLESGRQQAAFAPTDLSAFTAELAAEFESACARAGLALRIDCPPLDRPVFVDPALWEKVVLNLLSNAFRYTLQGGIAVEVAAVGEAVELRVRDTGVGIPAIELPRIFERFHRVRGAEGRSFEGAGIGLALVSEIVQLHGGRIRAESTPGAGSMFCVQLPFGSDHLPPEQVLAAPSTPLPDDGAVIEEALSWLGDPSASAAAADVGVSTCAGDLVIADDNGEMRAYLRRLLEAAGHRVAAEASNGEAALDEIRRSRPDLVLSDVMMPRLDGFGLLRAVRGDPALATTPVILLSARAGEGARIEGLDAGADDYLVKPFSARELVARVDGAIRLSRLRRDLEDKLRQAQKMEALGQLTGGIAHDFNNLLTAIVGGLEMVLDRPLDARGRRLVENALAAGQRGAKLTTQLLSFARAQRLDLRAVDIAWLLEGMSDLLTRSIAATIAVRIAIDPQARFAAADPNQLELTVLNLAINARDAMPEGGRLTISSRLETVLEDGSLSPGDYVVLSVADTGEGMPAEVAARAFEPFYTTKEVGRGSGLGLSQAYAMARRSGGDVRLHTVVGQGTTMEIFLRKSEPPAEKADVPADTGAAGSGRDRSASTVLLVDDDANVRSLFVQGLADSGYRVFEAADGAAGLGLLQRETPDILVVDYAMPGMTGAQFAKIARERHPHLPVLFVTGFAATRDLDEVAGASVLRKPLLVPELVAAVDRALAAELAG